jgi:RNA polymerase sigma factor (sigma-70 family)
MPDSISSVEDKGVWQRRLRFILVAIQKNRIPPNILISEKNFGFLISAAAHGWNMNERQSDFELLQRHARHGDQPAFTTLVRRHLDLVYATALRKVQDSGAAEEVAQDVFTALMKKAWQFAPDDSLPAWLYKSSLLESRHWLRGELRRRHREQTAVELGTTMNTPDEEPALRTLVPMLDEALLSLREKDRAALLLRFYESQPLRDVGASLGVSEDAAQKRITSALGKLSGYFQRRGFKTATVAATAAALQHTAISAPALVTNALVLATAQMTPPALTGLTAVAARLAALTKFQTAAVCVVLAVGPVLWQWNSEKNARQKVMYLQNQLKATQMDLVATLSEIDRLMKDSEGLAASSAEARNAADRLTEAQNKYVVWKNHLRTILTSEEYRWPEDSPFVRIPKSVLHELYYDRSINPPGTLKQETRELLGLMPQERKQIEATLQNHFATMDDLIEKQIIETNQSAHFHIPVTAVASVVWVVPPLGDEVLRHGEELQTALEGILGGERWPVVKAQLDSSGSDTLRRTSNLDAGMDGQEVAVWIQKENGKSLASFGFSSGSATMTTGGLVLEYALPGSETGASGDAWGCSFGLPESLTQRIQGWLKLQAEKLPEKESSK